jgi:hypothetical protein
MTCAFTLLRVYWNPRNSLLLFLGYLWPYCGGNQLEWLCLVNGTTVEVKWSVPLVIFWDCAPYWLEWLVITLMTTLIWDWVRELRVGKWRILNGKVESGLILDSELLGGSPRLGRLRTASCWSMWNKHWLVLAHARFFGSCKPCSFCNCLVKP